MEKYKAELQKRLRIAVLYNAIVLILVASGVIHMVTGSSEQVNDYISGFNIGFFIGVQMVMLFHMRKYHAAIKDEEKLRQLYIIENDERNQFIQAKIGGAGMNMIICGLVVGTIVSGYFNETVFFSLFGAMLFTVAVKLVLKVIYAKRY